MKKSKRCVSVASQVEPVLPQTGQFQRQQRAPRRGLQPSASNAAWKDSACHSSCFQHFSWAWSLTPSHTGSFSTTVWWTVLRVSKSRRKLFGLHGSYPCCWLELGCCRGSKAIRKTSRVKARTKVVSGELSILTAHRPPFPSDTRCGSGVSWARNYPHRYPPANAVT